MEKTETPENKPDIDNKSLYSKVIAIGNNAYKVMRNAGLVKEEGKEDISYDNIKLVEIASKFEIKLNKELLDALNEASAVKNDFVPKTK